MQTKTNNKKLNMTRKIKMTTVKAPLRQTRQMNGGFEWDIEGAPYHQTEGQGVRVHVKARVAEVFTNYQTTSSTCIGWATSTASAAYDTRVVGSLSPTFDLLQSGATVPGVGSIFGTGVSSTQVKNLVALFSKYNVRKLRVEYVPKCSANTSVEVVLGISTNTTDYTTPTFEQATMMKGYTSTAAWIGTKSVMIDDRDMKSPASYLYSFGAEETNSGEWVNSGTVLRGPPTQFHIFCLTDTPTSSEVKLGYLIADYVIDLYSWEPIPHLYAVRSPVALTSNNKLEVDKKEVCVKVDSSEKKVDLLEKKVSVDEEYCLLSAKLEEEKKSSFQTGLCVPVQKSTQRKA